MGKKLAQRDRSNQAVVGNSKTKTAAKKAPVKKAARPQGKSAVKKSDTASRGKSTTRAQPGRDQDAVEFSQDHLAAAAEFARSVGGIQRAQGLLNYLASSNSQNIRDREVL